MKNLNSLILYIFLNFCIFHKTNGVVNFRGGLEVDQYNCLSSLYTAFGDINQFPVSGSDYNFCVASISNTCNITSSQIISLNITGVSTSPNTLPPTALGCVNSVTTVLLANQNLNSFIGSVPEFIKKLTIKNSQNVFPLPIFLNLDTLEIENDKNVPINQDAYLSRNLTIDFSSIQNLLNFKYRDSFKNVNYSTNTQFTTTPRLSSFESDLCDIPDLTNFKLSLTMHFISNDINYFNKSSYIKFNTFNKVTSITLNSIKTIVSFPFPYQLQTISNNSNLRGFVSTICFDPVQTDDQRVNLSNFKELLSFSVDCPKSNDRSFLPIKQVTSNNMLLFQYSNSNFTSLSSLDIFSNVSWLVLKNNNFNGPIPKKNSIYPNIIDLSNNNFTGALDNSYCNSYVNVSGSRLITSVPTCYTCHLNDYVKSLFIGVDLVQNTCDTIIPTKLVLSSNGIITLHGYDLGLDTEEFESVPSLDWSVVPVLNGTTFEANTNTISGFSSLNTMVISFVGQHKANFTLSLKPIAPEFHSIVIGERGSFEVNGQYFTYDQKDVTIVIDDEPANQVQCSTITFDHLVCNGGAIRLPITSPPIILTDSVDMIDAIDTGVPVDDNSGLTITLSTMTLTIGQKTTKVYYYSMVGAFNNETCQSCPTGQICNLNSGVCITDSTTPTVTPTTTPTVTPLKCKNDCFNQGTCRNGVCACNPDRLFDDCSGIKCSGDCSSSLGQGDCSTSVGQCKCSSKYTGSNCELPNHFVSSNIPCSIDGGLVVLKGWYGELHNELSVIIGDSICSIESKSSTEIQCKITSGSIGIKSINVTQNNVIWFGTNQYEYLNTIKQCSSCSAHGKCDTKGVCICDPGYKGYDCLGIDSTKPDTTTSTTTSTTQEPTIAIPVSKPIVNITTGGAAIKNEQTNYKILLKSIVELDINGGTVFEYLLDGKWTLSNGGSSVSGSVVTTFTQPIYNTNANNNESIITSTIEDLSSDKNYTFAGIDFTVTAGSIKVSVEILKWSYSSSLNTLQLRMESLVSNDENDTDQSVINTCNTNESNVSSDKLSDNNLNNVKIQKDAKILYGRFLGRAVSDGYSTFITNQIVSNTSTSLVIGINLPHCIESCYLDPDFSVLVSPDFKSADSCVSDDNSKSWFLPVVIVVPVVGASILAISSVVIYRKNRTNIKIGLSKLNRIR